MGWVNKNPWVNILEANQNIYIEQLGLTLIVSIYNSFYITITIKFTFYNMIATKTEGPSTS